MAALGPSLDLPKKKQGYLPASYFLINSIRMREA